MRLSYANDFDLVVYCAAITELRKPLMHDACDAKVNLRPACKCLVYGQVQ
jgi:hypothetical protein